MNSIIELCNDIKENKKCTGCGASKYNNCECIYCGNINYNLKKLVSKLNDALNNVKKIDNNVLVSLYNIRDLDIKEINNILGRYNFDSVINDKIDSLYENKYGLSIDKEDIRLFISLLDSNSLSRKDIDFISMSLMRFMVLGKLDTNNTNKKIVFKYFTELFMRDKMDNPICIYTDKIDAQGDSFYNVIRYKETDVDKLLEEDNYIELLRLAFHECTHTFQNYYIHKGTSITSLLFLQTKEQIIRDYYPNYYKENYNNYLEEVEARYNEFYSLLQIMKVFKLKMSDKAINVINEEMVKEQKNMNNRKRMFNGKEAILDEIFDSIILNTNDLYKYPLLNLQYKLDNGIVVNKSNDEIRHDYEIYLDGVVDGGDKEQIEYLYKNVLGIEEYKKST